MKANPCICTYWLVSELWYPAGCHHIVTLLLSEERPAIGWSNQEQRSGPAGDEVNVATNEQSGRAERSSGDFCA